MIISAIYAISENGVIGNKNDLPWHIPADLQHFKQITLGKTIIMGRKTFDSMGRPLPKRRHIVVTRDKNWTKEGVEVAESLEKALAMVKGELEIFIIGGSILLEYAFDKNYINRIYQTLIHAEVEGDVFFNIPCPEKWEIISADFQKADHNNQYSHTFIELQMKQKNL